MGSGHVEVRFQAQARHDSNGPGLLGCCHLANDLERPTDNAQSPEQGGGCRCLPNFKDIWSPPDQLMSGLFLTGGSWLYCFGLPAPVYAASSSVASAGAGRAACSWVTFVRAWCNGSYTSPLTHRRCSNTASFRATATTARFFAFFPPRSHNRSPYRRKSLSGPKAPNMYCALPTSNRRNIRSPVLLIPNWG